MKLQHPVTHKQEFLLLTYILNNRHTSVKGRTQHGCIYMLLNTVLATDVNKYSLKTASANKDGRPTGFILIYV